MWEEEQAPPPAAEEPIEVFEERESAPNVAWTDGQLVRLENEWRRAQRSFAYHPSVGIAPLRGDPPYEYQVDFRVRTLMLNEAGDLQYVDEVSMHVWLPPGFPNQPPVVRPMAAVFHPNIAWEGVYLTRPWQTSDTLVDHIARVGDLLAYRSYDPESVVNAVAIDWLAENHGMLPLDARADFSAYAGGDPLGRIQRHGQGTLDQLRRALDDMAAALMNPQSAPTAQETADFARQTRTAASLFLDGDVPEKLREQAAAIDDWSRELPDALPLWDYLRHQRARSTTTDSTAVSIRNTSAAVDAALTDLAKMVKAELINSPASAVKLIPSLSKLQPVQLSLPRLVRELDQRVTEMRGLLDGMKKSPPHLNLAPDGSMGRPLAALGESTAQSVAAAIRLAQTSLNDVAAIHRRAKADLMALEQVVGWREYMDMFAKVRAMEKQVMEWGSGGVQAFDISNSSGSFGPFQFEEPLDLGGTRIVVRSVQGGVLDVIDAVGQDVLGRASNGSATVVLGQSEAEPGYQTQFRLTGRCDDLIIQFDFMQKQTVEVVAKLQRPVSGAKGWCGVISAMLADPHQQNKLRDAHRKAAHRWKALMTDLAHLAKFKERLATYHLVERMGEEAPRVRELIAATQNKLKESTDKVQAIMGKSSRDAQTDRLVIPPKYLKLYQDELRARDVHKHEIARLEGLLKQIGTELIARLSEPRLCGRAEIPRFRVMAPIPDAMASLQEAMGDESLKKLAAALGEQLAIQIPVNLPPPSSSHVSRFAQPGLAARSDVPAHKAPLAPVRSASPSAQATTPANKKMSEGAGKTSTPPQPSAAAPSQPAKAPVAAPPEPAPVEPGAAESDSLYSETAEEQGTEQALEYAESEGGDDIIADFFSDAASTNHESKPNG
ncbi:MAG TPA: hypothetical protein VG326_13565 [Tepidisphaeraceae bacterium]|jgi:ubiquitin-protein ligase|nr:hypothetical protein [Tepidisphaeraceae bacterium]